MVDRPRLWALLLAATLMAALGLPAFAGSETHPNRLTEDVLVQRVRWPVLVEPRRGAEARCAALTPADLELKEDGRVARITSIDASRGDTLYVLLVDVSASMAEHLDGVRKAVLAFARQLAEHDSVAIFAFSRECERLLPPSRDAAAIERAAARIGTGEGYTALVDALYEVIDDLDQRTERKAIVLISDGEENSSTRYQRNQLVKHLEELPDVRIFPIVTAALDNFLTTGMLHVIAASTGGNFELASDDRRVLDVLERVRDRVNHEVLITYAPPARPAIEGDRTTMTLRVKVHASKGVPCRIKPSYTQRVVPLARE